MPNAAISSAADGELFVVAVNDRRFRTRGAQEAEAFVLRHLFQQFFGGHGFGGIKHGAADDGAHQRNVFQRHLRRAVFANADADVRADELQIGLRNSGDANLVGGAGEERRERRGERHMAARGVADRDGDEVLFRDETFNGAFGKFLEKFFRESGIFGVAVQCVDARIGLAEADERRAVGFARGDLVAQLVADGRIARGRGEIWRGQRRRRGNRHAEAGLGAWRKFRDGLRGFFLVQRLAVPAVFVLQKGYARAFVSLGDDHQRFVVQADAAQDFHDFLDVVAVNGFYAPAEGVKAFRINADVVAERRGLALAEAVGVHDGDEIVQPVSY